MEKLILVTNDDGVSAKGIHALAEVASSYGKVVVVAPDSPQSGMGHAITINHPLRLSKTDLFGNIEAYSCTGTPVDSVKLGIYEVLNCKPDLVLSGINHGENSSTNVLYSGTMSAAIEGAMEGIPSIGFSLADFDTNADFSAAKHFAGKTYMHLDTANRNRDHPVPNQNSNAASALWGDLSIDIVAGLHANKIHTPTEIQVGPNVVPPSNCLI